MSKHHTKKPIATVKELASLSNSARQDSNYCWVARLRLFNRQCCLPQCQNLKLLVLNSINNLKRLVKRPPDALPIKGKLGRNTGNARVFILSSWVAKATTTTPTPTPTPAPVPDRHNIFWHPLRQFGCCNFFVRAFICSGVAIFFFERKI